MICPSETGNPGPRILHHEADIVRGDQQQKETNADARPMRDARRQIAQNPRAHARHRDRGEHEAHQEHRAERDIRLQALAEHEPERGEGRQRNCTADRNGQARPDAHQQRAECRRQAHGDEHRAGVEARLAEHARHDEHGIDHREKRRDASDDFLASRAAARGDVEIAVNERRRLVASVVECLAPGFRDALGLGFHHDECLLYQHAETAAVTGSPSSGSSR